MSFFKTNIFVSKDKSQKTLLEREQDAHRGKLQFQTLWDFLPMAVCRIDLGGRITEANQAFLRLTSFNPGAVLEKPLNQFFTAKLKLEEIISSFAKTGRNQDQEIILIDYFKKQIPVHINLAPTDDHQGYYIAIINVAPIKELQQDMEAKIKERTADIENSRTALLNMLEDTEEARSRAEEEKVKTETIFANFVDGLLVFDLDESLQLMNEQAEKFLGVKGGALLKKTMAELLRNEKIKPLLDILDGRQKEIFRKEFSINSEQIFEATSMFVVSGQKKISFLVIIHDVTRERAIEDLKSQFVSVAAHQLRTPLSIIKWGLGMFLGGDVGRLTKDQKDLLNKTYQTNERMIKLVNDLLNVSKIEEGRYLYQPKVVNIEDMVKQIFNNSEELAKKKKIKFELDIDKNKKDKLVKIDAEKIELAIKNIIDNAINYTPASGKVTIDLSRAGDAINLEIKDTGVGIPEKQQDRVFSRFFRAANVVKMETDGTGLGLFIAKNVIEAHGGKISFKSKEGQGTDFLITLPAAA